MTAVRDAYDAWAASYDADANRTRDLDAAELRRRPPALAGRRVLELACGTGKNTGWLAARSAALVATDLSWGMLLRARRRDPDGVRFVLHDAARGWPFRAAAFDLVVVCLVLEHVADLAAVYAEAARVLADGGELLVSELHPERQAKGARARYVGADGAVRHVDAWVHPTAEHLDAARAAGLDLVDRDEPRAPGDALPRLLRARFRRDGATRAARPA